MCFNLASTLHFDPEMIDRMKFYMACIYLRRLKKAGYFGDNKEKKEKTGTAQDFGKIFGTQSIS